MILESREGFFNIEGKAYHEREDCKYTISRDRIPLAIIYENQLIPEGTDLFYIKNIREIHMELQDHVMKGIRHAEKVRMGMSDGNMDMKKIIGLGLLGIIVFAVIVSYIGG